MQVYNRFWHVVTISTLFLSSSLLLYNIVFVTLKPHSGIYMSSNIKTRAVNHLGKMIYSIKRKIETVD